MPEIYSVQFLTDFNSFYNDIVFRKDRPTPNLLVPVLWVRWKESWRVLLKLKEEKRKRAVRHWTPEKKQVFNFKWSSNYTWGKQHGSGKLGVKRGRIWFLPNFVPVSDNVIQSDTKSWCFSSPFLFILAASSSVLALIISEKDDIIMSYFSHAPYILVILKCF